MPKPRSQDYFLRYYVDGSVDVVTYREAGDDSVLAGQSMRGFVAAYPCEADALQAYPSADTSRRELPPLPLPF